MELVEVALALPVPRGLGQKMPVKLHETFIRADGVVELGQVVAMVKVDKVVESAFNYKEFMLVMCQINDSLGLNTEAAFPVGLV